MPTFKIETNDPDVLVDFLKTLQEAQTTFKSDVHHIHGDGISWGHSHTLCNKECECFPECRS